MVVEAWNLPMAGRTSTHEFERITALIERTPEPVTTPEVAAHLDVGRRSTYERLAKLAAAGKIQTKKVGAGARIWWAVDTDGNDGTDPGQRPVDTDGTASIADIETMLEAIAPFVDLAWIAEDTWTNLIQLAPATTPIVLADDESGEVIGSDWIAPEDRSRVQATFSTLTPTPKSVTVQLANAEDAPRWIQLSARVIEHWNRSIILVIGREMTNWMQVRERQASLESLIEEVIYIDSTGKITDVSKSVAGMCEATVASLVGKQIWEILAIDELGSEPGPFETELTPDEGHSIPVTANFHPINGEEQAGWVGTISDIRQQRQREAEAIQQRTALEVAKQAGNVGTWAWDLRRNRLQIDDWIAAVFGLDESVEYTDDDIETIFDRIHADDRDSVRGDIETAIQDCGPFETEYRVVDPAGKLRWIEIRGEVQCDETATPLTVAGTFIDITRRKQTEMTLSHQYDRLSLLNTIAEVVADVADAVVNQETPNEIEQTVCDVLAASDAYESAWVARADPDSQKLIPGVSAGTDGYAEFVDISTDPSKPTGKGPAGRAFREETIQIVRDITKDPIFEPWRGLAAEYPFTAVASIPIVTDGAVLGTLNLFTERNDAFGPDEQALISHLGETVGHAIGSAERKRALMGDDLIELVFQISDGLAAFGIEIPAGEWVNLDYAVPIGEDDYLVYGETTPAAIDQLTQLTEFIPHWSNMTVRSESTPIRIEIQVTNPPVFELVTSMGGYVDEVVLEPGDFQMTVHLPPGANVRRVIDQFAETYPLATLVRRRQISRPESDIASMRQAMFSALTERQRASLDAAYYSGYFDWPRATDGESVAESLGIAAPTFHQHLRKAQKKVFDAVYP